MKQDAEQVGRQEKKLRGSKERRNAVAVGMK